MTKNSTNNKPVVRIKTSEDLSYVKFELTDIKDMIKSEKNDLGKIIDILEKLI